MTDSRTTPTHMTTTTGDGRFRAIVEPADDDIRTHIPGAEFYVEIFDHDADAVAFEDTFNTFDRAERAAFDALAELVRTEGVWDDEDLALGRVVPRSPVISDPHDPYFNDADDNTLNAAR